jgi:hypothetical protein
MASSEQLQSPFFGLLPAELRIKTYESLLADYKGDSGKATALSALLTCSRMKAELEAEMPRMGLLNLDATIEAINGEWAKQSAVDAPLDIEVMVKGNAVRETELRIILPKSAFKKALQGDQWHLPFHMMEFLQPLLEFHLQQIDFILCADEFSETTDQMASMGIFFAAANQVSSPLTHDLTPEDLEWCFHDQDYPFHVAVNAKRVTLEWSALGPYTYGNTNHMVMTSLKNLQCLAWALEICDGSGDYVTVPSGPFPMDDVPYKAIWTRQSNEDGIEVVVSEE